MGRTELEMCKLLGVCYAVTNSVFAPTAQAWLKELEAVRTEIGRRVRRTPVSDVRRQILRDKGDEAFAQRMHDAAATSLSSALVTLHAMLRCQWWILSGMPDETSAELQRDPSARRIVLTGLEHLEMIRPKRTGLLLDEFSRTDGALMPGPKPGGHRP